MKHVRTVTIARAQDDEGFVTGVLDRIFSFVLALVGIKGKTPEA